MGSAAEAGAAFLFLGKVAILLLILVVIGVQGFSAPPETSFPDRIQPLLNQYCYKCHGTTKFKGGINLQQFKDEMGVYRDPKLWQTVLAQLRERSMPPDDKPQPSPEERDVLADWVQHRLDNLDHGLIPKDPGRVLIHRLSRLEYNNTVRDLFGVKIKPADKFPADGGGGAGFDNIADTLFVPPILMERFLAAADEILDATEPQRLFIAKPSAVRSKRSAARAIIDHFTLLAYRRPPEKEETEQLLSLFDKAQSQGQSFEDSVKLALKAMLVSPNFLFRIEFDQPGDAPYHINDYELASRLSYFLWSSMPDDELFSLAGQHRLNDPAMLEAQVHRMLLDPKSKILAENFTGQWLRVRELTTSAEPDPNRYPTFTPELRDAMIEEPAAMFYSILREDGRLLNLLDCNYTYVNEVLAKHYGIDGVQGNQFQRVQLSDDNRGGILGMGGVLTLTSYPFRTSPVLRGKWVLEEILGTPPPPPPPLVKSLPRDDKPQEGLTFRQQLERHRADASCANCHKRMDPLGFGLENFDAIGRWREKIGGVAVDASGVMATGEKFTGPAELKKLLLERRDLFIRNLTEKMLSYALGRGLDYYDTPAVKQIARTVAANDYRSSVLIKEIVTSYPFQYRRNKPITIVSDSNPPGQTSGRLAKSDSSETSASLKNETLKK